MRNRKTFAVFLDTGVTFRFMVMGRLFCMKKNNTARGKAIIMADLAGTIKIIEIKNLVSQQFRFVQIMH